MLTAEQMRGLAWSDTPRCSELTRKHLMEQTHIEIECALMKAVYYGDLAPVSVDIPVEILEDIVIEVRIKGFDVKGLIRKKNLGLIKIYW